MSREELQAQPPAEGRRARGQTGGGTRTVRHQPAVLTHETLVEEAAQVFVALAATFQAAEAVLRQVVRELRPIELLLVVGLVLLLAQELVDAGQDGHLVELILDAHILRRDRSIRFLHRPIGRPSRKI